MIWECLREQTHPAWKELTKVDYYHTSPDFYMLFYLMDFNVATAFPGFPWQETMATMLEKRD